MKQIIKLFSIYCIAYCKQINNTNINTYYKGGYYRDIKKNH